MSINESLNFVQTFLSTGKIFITLQHCISRHPLKSIKKTVVTTFFN